mgnify:FL=1
MSRVLVKLYVPIIEEKYDIWLPTIYNIIISLTKAVNELSMGYYTPIKSPMLYNKLSSTPYDVNITVKESDIRNGTELILI